MMLSWQTLAEAEKLLNQHQQLKEEVEGYANEYAQMKEYGENVVEGQDDVQYMFLREVSQSLTNSAGRQSRRVVQPVGLSINQSINQCLCDTCCRG